jgi:hypothetical protein
VGANSVAPISRRPFIVSQAKDLETDRLFRGWKHEIDFIMDECIFYLQMKIPPAGGDL